MDIERYLHVFLISYLLFLVVSSAFLPGGHYRHLFPAGTVSGAPKVRVAREIIEECWNLSPKPYAGALGYVSLNATSTSASLSAASFSGKEKRKFR